MQHVHNYLQGIIRQKIGTIVEYSVENRIHFMSGTINYIIKL